LNGIWKNIKFLSADSRKTERRKKVRNPKKKATPLRINDLTHKRVSNLNLKGTDLSEAF